MTNIDSNNRKKLHHYNTPGHAHELTFSCYRRLNYLDDPKVSEIVLTVLSEARDIYKFHLWAYVLMPNHVHLLIWPLQLQYDIAKIESGIKGITSKRYFKYLKDTNSEKYETFRIKSRGEEIFRFWQPGCGFDRNLWNYKAIHSSIEYIEANPVRKKFSSSPTDYQWSSAFARYNNNGLVPDHIDIPVAMLNPQYQRLGVV